MPENNPPRNVGSQEVQLLLQDPGIKQARVVVNNLKQQGIDVYYSPSSLMIVGQSKTKSPNNLAMDTAFPLHHEIGMLFALETMGRHFATKSATNKLLNTLSENSKNIPE